MCCSKTMFKAIHKFVCFCLILNFDQLFAEDRATYQKNVTIINELKLELQEKQEKYKNDKMVLDYFFPGFVSGIKDLEDANQALLNFWEAKLPLRVRN